MRLLEAIVHANQRAIAGDATAGLDVAEFSAALPLVALTCIDPRLNHLLPGALAIPEESFIWLRNAGNVITGPLSSTMRSLALACAVKGGKEIAVIGHSDCLVGKSTVLELTERLKGLGVDRARLPADLVEYFGLFASERQNVMKAVEHVRASPLIGARVPVHGLWIDLSSGRVEWLVNGYQATALTPAAETPKSLGVLSDFKMPETKFPEFKIGAGPEPAQRLVQHEARTAELPETPSKRAEPKTQAAAPPPVISPLQRAQRAYEKARRA